MLDVATILDPALKNPELRAFAYLSARYTQGVRSSVDCLLPFVSYAVSISDGKQFDIKTIQSYLKSSYRLNIPYYMLERMIPELKALGSLVESSIGRVLICKNVSAATLDSSVDFSASEIDEIEIALQSFASNRGYENPSTALAWNDLLIPFLQSSPPPKAKTAAAIHGKLISNPASVDYTIVAEFIMHQFSLQ